MDTANPLDALALRARRGPLHERLAALATAWREVNGYTVCTQVRHEVAGDGPWLACLSHCARIGFKGRGTAEWLQSEGVALPAAPNRWLRDTSGAVIARLGAQDFLIADDLDGESGLPERLAARWQHAPERGGYPVPRQHGLVTIALGGSRAPDVLARLCAVDLDAPAFAADAVAQTQIALTSAIVMRGPVAAGYRLHVDTAVGLYLFDVLHEVVTALGGGVLGEAQVPRA